MASENISIEQLGKQVVYNERNEPVVVSTLWQEQTAVLIFVRHFG